MCDFNARWFDRVSCKIYAKIKPCILHGKMVDPGINFVESADLVMVSFHA